MPLSFGVTFDYLCPWARNVNEHIVAGLRSGADWQVRFVPYSLSQGHVAEDDTPIWDRIAPLEESGILALQVGITVRDRLPERFLDVHEALFAVRHDRGEDTKDPEILARALDRLDLDGQQLVADASDATVTKALQREHEEGVRDCNVWGVPTLIGSERAVFVRVLDRPEGDAERARARIEHLVDLVDHVPEIHEFKQTDLPR